MNRTPIPWNTLLARFPGGTIGEKIQYARSLYTVPQLARDLNQNVNAVKSFCYHHAQSEAYPARKSYSHIVVSKPRPDYAGILSAVIRLFAQEQGMNEMAYRAWIATAPGQKEFEEHCDLLCFPLFECRYRPKIKNPGPSRGEV